MEEKPVLIPIPENYDSGIIFLGMSFRKERIIEALVIGATVTLITYLLLSSFLFIELSLRIGIALSFSLPLCFLCLKGIDEEDMISFVYLMVKTRFLIRDACFDETIREKRKKKESEKKAKIIIPVFRKEKKKSEGYIFEDDLKKERLWQKKRSGS